MLLVWGHQRPWLGLTCRAVSEAPPSINAPDCYHRFEDRYTPGHAKFPCRIGGPRPAHFKQLRAIMPDRRVFTVDYRMLGTDVSGSPVAPIHVDIREGALVEVGKTGCKHGVITKLPVTHHNPPRAHPTTMVRSVYEASAFSRSHNLASAGSSKGGLHIDGPARH